MLLSKKKSATFYAIKKVSYVFVFELMHIYGNTNRVATVQRTFMY
jgi:hypothetical protein